MKTNQDHPYDALLDALTDPDQFEIEAAAERIFGGGPIGDADPADAVPLGRPGNGADIDMDTFEPVAANS